VQVGLVLIQDAGPVGAGPGQQFLRAAGAGELADRLLRQSEFAHDRLDALALGTQRLHRRVAFPGPLDQRAPFGARGGGRGRRLFQVRCRAASGVHLRQPDPASHHIAEKVRQHVDRGFLARLRDQLISQMIVVDEERIKALMRHTQLTSTEALVDADLTLRWLCEMDDPQMRETTRQGAWR